MSAIASHRSRFPVIYGVIMLAVLLVGFGPSFFFRWLSNQPDLPVYLIVHGMAGTAWLLLFLTQVVLVARGKVQWHRQLGVLGIGIAIVLIVSGTQVTLAFAQKMAAQGDFVATNGSGPDFVYFAIAVSSAGVVGFAGKLGAALVFRQRRDIHGRLMLLAAIGLMGPAVSRIVNWIWPLPNPLMGVMLLFVIAMIVYDIRTRGRPHIATVLGSAYTFGLIGLFMALGVGQWMVQHAAR